ncbi:MAG TPA: metallophosphoesterase [Micromonosporaceae bacterium]
MTGVLTNATRTTWAALVSLRARIAGWRSTHPVVRRLGVGIALVAVTLVGLCAGLLLAGHTSQKVGPFNARFAITPSLHGGTEVDIPPLGSLLLRSHAGPAHLDVQLESLDRDRAEQLITDPNGVAKASDTAVEDVGTGLTRLILQAAGAGLLGALIVSAIVFRDVRRVALSGGLALATMGLSGGIAAATFRPTSIEEPRYQGLLANAPAVIGDARKIANQYDEYRAELQRLVRNVSKLYGAFSTLPVYEPDVETIRVLHISDMHLNPAAWSVVQTVVDQFGIDVVVDTGDLNDWGSQAESSYVSAIGSLKVPYVYIRGNHDSAVTAAAVAREPNAIVLENSITTVHGVTIAGIGDPRFTPDKTSTSSDPKSQRQTVDPVYRSAEKLAATIRASGRRVDIAMIHDPAGAGALGGAAPLVLAGHLHHRETRSLDVPPGKPGSLLMVEGSTGGAGLRGLEGDQPTPLELSVLYLNHDRVLQAYDDITVGGTGQSQVSLQRHIVTPEPGWLASGSPGPHPATPTPVPASPPATPTPTRSGR